MNNLIILSGCSGAGKSTFWQFLHRTPDAVQRVQKSIPFFDLNAAYFMDATKTLRRKLKKNSPIKFDKKADFVVLHYDITHVYRIGTRDFARDLALQYARRFDRVCFIHINAPPQQLQRQFQERALERINTGLKSDTIVTKLRHRLRKFVALLQRRRFMTEEEIYSDPRLIDEINRHWLRFVKTDMSLYHQASILMVQPGPDMAFNITDKLET